MRYVQGDLDCADAPPPYSANESSQELSTSTPPQSSARYNDFDQFRRYVIEIMGFTFNADFSLLNEALGQSSSTDIATTTSILSQEEHDELLRLSQLIRTVRKEIRSIWGTLDHKFKNRREPKAAADFEALASKIVRPAILWSVDDYYMLELINSYAAHRCQPEKRSTATLVSQNKPYFYGFFRRLTFLGPFNVVMDIFGQTLRYHADVIEGISRNDTVRTILFDAMNKYEVEELGSRVAYHVSDTDLGNFAWHDMGRFLVPMEERRRLWSRKRLRSLG